MEPQSKVCVQFWQSTCLPGTLLDTVGRRQILEVPRAVTTSAGWDWSYPPDPQLSCTCGPPSRRCAGKQVYVFSCCSGLGRRRPLCSRVAPTPAAQHKVERQLSRPNAESLSVEVTVTCGGQLHSLTRPGSLPTKAQLSY